MVTRQRASTSAGIGQLNLDSLTYDQRGKVVTAKTDSRVQAPEGVSYVYDVHGAVVAQERSRGSGSYHVEEFRNDAYGNAFFSRTRSSTGANDAPSVAFFNPDGALYDRHTVLPGTVQQNHREELISQGAAPAALETTSRLVAIPPVNGGGAASQLASKQYYSADQRLMVVQRYDYLVGSTTDVGTWEEHRYDALGRRILTRARRDFLNTPDSSRALCNDPVGGSCGSYIQRSLWDGDQLLYEWRVPEAAPTGMTSGSAGYVHLEGIDQPIGLIRPEGTRVINYTRRGLGESSVFTNGNSGDCSMFYTGCAPVQWPGKTQAGVYFTPNLLASGPSGPYTWFGTLAENGGGSTGMLFRRNRYFDPVSGRFTQQDPIGVAGGLNLYGFADGDPVNFSDPFGLMACPPYCDVFQQLAAWAPAMKGILAVGAAVAMAPAVVAIGADAAIAGGGATALNIATRVGSAGPAIAGTVHGAQRMADPSRLSPQQAADAMRNFTQRFTQGDGAQAFIQEVGGKFNVVIRGDRGVITTFRNLSEKKLARLAKNYEWTAPK